jgi:hypothetical protein
MVGAVGHEDVDLSWLENFGEISDSNLTSVHRNNHSLRPFNDRGLELCLVIVRCGDLSTMSVG